MLKRTKRKEKKLPLLVIEPRPLFFNVVQCGLQAILACLNTLQSGGNA
jgi:hypothetical protein